MNKITSITTLALIFSTLIGCSSDEGSPFTEGAISSTNIIYDNNFSIAVDDLNPEVIEVDVGTTPDANHRVPVGNIVATWGPIEVTITATAGDKDNALVTSGRVYFASEYGLLSAPYCDLGSTGTCTVTWYSQTNIAALDDGTGLNFDTRANITAWTMGEESFSDSLNGNGTLDDGENTFTDTEEPFIDLNSDGNYDTGETQVYDTNSDGLHTGGDGEYNGSRCTHSTLCSATTIVPIQARTYLDLWFETTP